MVAVSPTANVLGKSLLDEFDFWLFNLPIQFQLNAFFGLPSALLIVCRRQMARIMDPNWKFGIAIEPGIFLFLFRFWKWKQIHSSVFLFIGVKCKMEQVRLSVSLFRYALLFVSSVRARPILGAALTVPLRPGPLRISDAARRAKAQARNLLSI